MLGTYYQQVPWKSAKEQLKAESATKCAYCESSAEAQFGDVEHFRPKNQDAWWWLACCYENLLFSCQICNQSYKRSEFPLKRGGKARGESKINESNSNEELKAMSGSLAPDPLAVDDGRSLASYLIDCANEKPLLIHPYQEKPEDFIIYEADATLRTVKVRPRKAAHKARIKACEECFGINREALCLRRWGLYLKIEKLWLACQIVPSTDKQCFVEALSLCLEADAEFAGMARYFIREVWQVPGL